MSIGKGRELTTKSRTSLGITDLVEKKIPVKVNEEENELGSVLFR